MKKDNKPKDSKPNKPAPNKSSDNFKTIIKQHLDERAASDKLFAEAYAKPHKNIDACINQIISEVRKSGVIAWSNEEIFNMAIHYYDEDNIANLDKAPKCKIVVSDERTPGKPIKRPAPKAKEPAKPMYIQQTLF